MSYPYRVVIVEHGPELLQAGQELVARGIGCTRVASDSALLPAALNDLDPDVVLLDSPALDLVPMIRELRPHSRVLVLATVSSVDAAVKALRSGAHDFLTGPVASDELAATVTRLADDARSAASASGRRQRVLAIGAHPDDVEAGVGGMLAAHAASGDQVTILTVSKGRREGGVQLAWEEASASASKISATLVLEDQLDSFGSALTVIRRVVAEVQPTIVYTHSHHDRRQDHRLIYEATVAGTEEVPTVACYQGTTGTIDFAPSRFVPIDGFTETKLAMLACFASRGVRASYLDPDFVLSAARYWSQYGEGRYCEPLEIIRESVLAPVAPALSTAQLGTGGHATQPVAVG
jgi:LmbE family N-acetylglucosaminyl deacetylase/CheY-like chemotaxis protein